MKNIKVKQKKNPHLWAYILLAILLFCTVDLIAQNVVVLPYNGTSSSEHSPQGYFSYQRHFYLITPEEMSETDLQNGWDIVSMGFTIAAAQDTTTKGVFKVYLQNTDDTISRLDTAWTYDTVTVNNYPADDLFPGTYEWQVKSLCSDGSMFSDKETFSNKNLPECTQPDSLYTTNITASSVILHWNSMNPPGFSHFLVEYRRSDEDTWMSDTTSNTTDTLTGLDSDQSYIWRVRTICTGENSPSVGGSFYTAYEENCDAPTSLSTGVVADTTAEVAWTEATDAFYYEIRYRRIGTDFWSTAISAIGTYNIQVGLMAGTTYEWQVRTICPDGQSAFISGPDFTTTGTPVCYAPGDLNTTSVTEGSAVFSWSSVSGAVQYVVRYRLTRTISWASAINGMICVHDDSITIPDTKGPFFIPFVNGTAFTYSGGGLYIAFECMDTSGNYSTLNTALCNSQASDTLSFASELNVADTQQAEVLNLTGVRPETWLGANSLKDTVEVEAVYALGYNAIPYGNPAKVEARIRNHTLYDKTFTVTLTVKDVLTQSVRYTTDQNVTIDSAGAAVLSFTGWSPSEYGTDEIIISVPAQGDENLLDNNEKTYLQGVNPYLMSHADHTSALLSASIGFGSGEGIIMNKHTVAGCVQVLASHVYLDWSALGQTVYGVVLDDGLNVVAESDTLVPDTGDVNTYFAFYFDSPPEFTSEDFYVGLAQKAGSSSYYPVGVQWEGLEVRTGAYYRANLDGTNVSDTAAEDRPMIKAEIMSSKPVPFIDGDEILCASTSATLTAGSRTMRYANEVIDYSSQYDEYAYNASATLGTENVYPVYAISPDSWIPEEPDDGREYLVLGFPNPGPVNTIQIFENFGPGAIDSVYVKDPGSGNYDLVYSDSAHAAGDEARILEIQFTMTTYDVSEIRIAVNDTAVDGFNAIDAVAIGQSHVPANFDTYLWSPGGETTSSITISSQGTYGLEVSVNGCSAWTEIEVVTPSVIVPTITARGPISFCEGESVWLVSSEQGNNTWSTGETTDSILVDTTGSYTVSYYDGCVTSTSAAVVVTAHPLPVVDMSGAVICQGESAVLDAGAGYTQYDWSTGESTQTITVSISQLYTVTVTDAFGCVGSGGVVPIVQIPPSPEITGELAFCPGDSTELDAGAGYTQYDWSTGESTQTIVVSTAGLVDVTVTDNNGCTGTDAVTIVEYVPPTPHISGALGFCLGSATQLDAGAGYASYAWSTGESSQMISVDYAGTFEVTVTDYNGCTGTASATTTTEGSIPDPPGPITGPTQGLCGASGLVYTIDPVPNTTHYVWTVPDGSVIVSGQGSTSIIVNVSYSFTSGDIVVAASNPCGQSPSIDPTFITIYGVTEAPGSIEGPKELSCNQSGAIYSIVPVVGASDYTWTVPSDAVITDGQGTIMISVDFGVEDGQVCVSTNNPCGASDLSCITVTMTDFDVDAGECAYVSPTTPPFDCTELQASTTGGVPPFIYEWSTDDDGIIGNSEAIVVCPTEHVIYYLQVTDADGCIARDMVEVYTVNAGCSKKKVNVCHNGETMCLNTRLAQRHLAHGDRLGSCDDPDPCGMDPLPFASNPGDYDLNPVDLMLPATESSKSVMHVYPNPTAEYFHVSFESFDGDDIELEIYHPFLGAVRKTGIIDDVDHPFRIDIGDLSSGMYIIRAKGSNGRSLSSILIISR